MTMQSSLKRMRDELEDTIGPHILSCLRESKHVFSNNIKMPWERQFVGPVDVVRNVFKLPVPLRELSQNAVAYNDTGSQHDSIEVGSAFRKAGLKLVKTCDERLWSERLSAERKAAIRKWTSLIASEPAAWDVAIKFFSQGDMAYATGGLSQSIQDALAGKASSTLHSRVKPLFRLVKFCNDHGRKAFPVNEAVIYDYLKSDDNFAPTFPRSLLISLSFAKHVLGLRGDVESAITGRCKGVTHNFFVKKRRLLQRPALSVAQVIRLENVVMDEGAGMADRIAAGFFCFTLYSRARYSDASSVVKLTQDIVLRDGVAVGFLEADASPTKTSTTLERKTRFFAFDLTSGFGGENRLCENVDAVETCGAFGDWRSKFGVKISVRRALGYHHTNADRSVNTYARDAMAAPLRILQQVITAISDRKFLPDQTRSGMFADAGMRATAQGLQDHETVESSSESSGDEEQHDVEQEESAVDTVARAWQLNKDTGWMALSAVYFRHKSSRCIHVLQDESGANFLCGRSISVHYVRLERRPEFLHPVCTTCERAVARNSST
eukprot:s2855_g3.t1